MKFFYDSLFLKRGASSRRSSSLYCLMRNSDEMTIGKTHPTLLAQFQPGKSLNYGETLLVRNLENDFENVENWLAIAMDKGTVEIPDWRSQLDSGQFKIIIT